MSYEDDYAEDWQEYDDDSTPTVVCSNCQADVYEEADRCPNCGEFLIGTQSPLVGKPTWYVVIGLLGIVAVLILFSGILQWL